MSIGFRAGVVCSLAVTASVHGAPPQGFSNQLVASGMGLPTALAFLPDGRLLIGQKGGVIRIADPSTAPMPTSIYMTITNIDSGFERGLEAIVLDPNFAANGWFYTYYSASSPARFRIARFTHQQNAGGLTSIGVLASEFVVWQDSNNFSSCCHYGGGLGFGPDGRLWLTTGEEFDPQQSQDPTRSGGKVIRVNADSSVPADNPFHDGAGPNDDSIWALGLRNPFRASWDLPTGRFLIGEVGGNVQPASWEDVHVARLDMPGVNYGWPSCEGSDACTNDDFPACIEHSEPVFAYPHLGQSASITGGFVYRGSQFPADPYIGAYFYGDYARSWIRFLTFDPDDPMRVTGDFPFEPSAGAVISFAEAPDGSLWYARVDGQVRRIAHDTNQAPIIVLAEASPVAGPAPLHVVFSGAASDAEGDRLEYVWNFGDGAEMDGQVVDHDYLAVGAYECVLEVSDASHTTFSEPIVIQVGSPPALSIDEPIDGSLFRAGDTIEFSASSTALGAIDFEWTVLFHHNEHTHPVLGPVAGASGTFPISTSGHDYSDSTSYEFISTVTDAQGLHVTDSVFVFPDKVEITFDTLPSGLTIVLDSIPRAAPFVHDTLIGFEHDVSVRLVQCADDVHHAFTSWSNGGGQTHTYVVPDANAALVATYSSGGACDVPVTSGLVARFRADDVPVSGGAAVTSWPDASGIGNHLGVPAGAGPPTLLAGALNGHDVVAFDGANDALGRTGFTGLPVGSADRSVFMVVRYSENGWGGFAWGTNQLNRTFGLCVSASGMFAVQGWGTSNDFPSDLVANGAGWATQVVVLSGNSLTQHVNGVALNSANHAFDTATNFVRVGEEMDGAPNVAMQIAEILVYDRAVSEAERQEIQEHLEHTYLVAPTIVLTSPVHGALIPGDEVLVSWTTETDVEPGSHVHVRLDGGSLVEVLALDGFHTYTGVSPGAHTVSVNLASAAHAEYPHCEAMSEAEIETGACPGDFNGDGDVGFFDLAVLLVNWQPAPNGQAPWDLNGDGEVGFFDLASVLTLWGACP